MFINFFTIPYNCCLIFYTSLYIVRIRFLGFALWKLLFVTFNNLLVFKKPCPGQVGCSPDRGHSVTLNPGQGGHRIFGFCGG